MALGARPVLVAPDSFKGTLSAPQVAEAIAHSAARRKESRGSHQRLDHPERDDANYLKHSLATYRGSEPPTVGYCDVVITRSKPAERVYGGAAA